MSEKATIRKSFLAGVLIAIGALFSIAAKPYGNVVQGLCFSVGLFGVLCCGARLFTGQVLAVSTIWDKDCTISDVLMLWATVWAWNLLGAVCVALMASQMGFDASAIAQAKASMPWNELLVRSILCNVLVCMAVWTRKTGVHGGWDSPESTLASCVLPVACFVACGFEHSVADMLYMPLGFFNGAVNLVSCLYVIGVATIGNVIGGIGFAWLVWERQ